MFIALYEFKCKPGMEAQFEAAWHRLTEAIYAHRGSLGSRLHRAGEGSYVAYAQWPSEEQYRKDIPLPSEAMAASASMRAALEGPVVTRTMTACDDLLRAGPYGD